MKTVLIFLIAIVYYFIMGLFCYLYIQKFQDEDKKEKWYVYVLVYWMYPRIVFSLTFAALTVIYCFDV